MTSTTEKVLKLGMVVKACNADIKETGDKDSEFKASLGYILRIQL